VTAFERQLERWKAAAATGAGPTNIREWFRNDARVWLYDMCDGVGVARPPGSAADEIASDALRFVRENLTFHIPLVVDRLRELRRRGIILHIASGDAHEDLVQYLEAMGIRKLFGRVYGSDLVNVWKTSAAYYRAILAETGTDPITALVIDDSDRAIGWAAESGLRGVLVRRQAGESFEDAVLRAFDEVNALL
jgi:FMN phosphatase YigB (HAD superfamily)